MASPAGIAVSPSGIGLALAARRGGWNGWYGDGTTARKFTISLPEDLDRTVADRRRGGRVSVSAWLAQAAAQVAFEQAIVVDGRVALDEFVAKYGPITSTEDQNAWISRVLADADAGGAGHRVAT